MQERQLLWSSVLPPAPRERARPRGTRLVPAVKTGAQRHEPEIPEVAAADPSGGRSEEAKQAHNRYSVSNTLT